jgi:hypothetical protein
MSTQETAENCERLLAKHDKAANHPLRMSPKNWAGLIKQGFRVEVAPPICTMKTYRRVKRPRAQAKPADSISSRAVRAATAYLDQDPTGTVFGMPYFAALEGCSYSYVSYQVSVLRKAREAAGIPSLRLYTGERKPLPVVANSGPKQRKKETQPRKYGKHNPVPPEMKAEIVRRALVTGRGREKYEHIAASLGLTACTVRVICFKAGISRAPGRWPVAA